jgi:CRISPR-associated exonuclease Cas4
MDTDEGIYQATPQTRGSIAHETVDKKTAGNKKADIISLPVYSEEFGIMGKIDIYHQDKKLLVERKYQLKKIFRGQIYQLWAQYFCMIEMGYKIEHIAFYDMSVNKTIPIELPGYAEQMELKSFIEDFKHYDPEDTITVNPNKCTHCIYCNLCDKTESDNVYT